jgi:hypothetical protein
MRDSLIKNGSMILAKKQIKTGKNGNGVLLYWMFNRKK